MVKGIIEQKQGQYLIINWETDFMTEINLYNCLQ